MQRFGLTIQNYRPFPHVPIAEFRFDPGTMAIVGPNNAGKSSLARLFYEFRNVFLALSEALPNNALRVGALQSPITIKGGASLEDILHDGSDKPLALTFDLSGIAKPESGIPGPKQVVLTLARDGSPWHIQIDDKLPNASAKSSGGDRVAINSKDSLDLTEMRNFFACIADSMYIGSSRGTAGESSGDYFDIPINSRFVDLWNKSKNGDNRAVQHLTESITEDVRALLGFKKLEINAAFQKPTLDIIIDGRHRKLDDVGAGTASVILLILNVALRTPSYLFLDEPELHLHPQLQRDLLALLGKYVKETIVFTTHSVGLARSGAERCYGVKLVTGGATAALFQGVKSLPEFLGEMSYSAFQDLGFDTLLLVEGVTEVKLAQVLLSKLGLIDRVVIVPLGGDGMTRGSVNNELAELQRIAPRVFALVDSERTVSNGPPKNERTAFKASCDQLSIKVHLTDRRATENYLCDRAIKSVMRSNAYSELAEFAQPTAPFWGKNNNWKIADEMTADEWGTTDIWEFLKEIDS